MLWKRESIIMVSITRQQHFTSERQYAKRAEFKGIDAYRIHLNLSLFAQNQMRSRR